MSPLSIKSSATPLIKKSANTNKLSGNAGIFSIASSNTKVQCHQFTSIHFNDHDPSSKFPSYNLNSPLKKLYFKINQETKKITRSNNTSSLSIATSSSPKKTIRPNNTNSLSSKPATS